jgi:hypothetical protein
MIVENVAYKQDLVNFGGPNAPEPSLVVDNGRWMIVAADGKTAISEFAPGRYFGMGLENRVADYSGHMTALGFGWYEGQPGKDGWGVEEGGIYHGKLAVLDRNGTGLEILDLFDEVEKETEERTVNLKQVVVLPNGEVVAVMTNELKDPRIWTDEEGHYRRSFDENYYLVKFEKGETGRKKTEVPMADFRKFIGLDSELGLVFDADRGKLALVDPLNLKNIRGLELPEGGVAGVDKYRGGLVAVGQEGVFGFKNGEWKMRVKMPEEVVPVSWFTFGDGVKIAPNGITAFDVQLHSLNNQDEWGVGVLGTDNELHVLGVADDSVSSRDTEVADDGIRFNRGSKSEKYQPFAQGKLGLMANEIKFGQMTVSGGSIFLETAEDEKYEIVVGVQPEDETMKHWEVRVRKLMAELAKSKGQAYLRFEVGGYVEVGGIGAKDQVPVNLIDVRVKQSNK